MRWKVSQAVAKDTVDLAASVAEQKSLLQNLSLHLAAGSHVAANLLEYVVRMLNGWLVCDCSLVCACCLPRIL